MQIFIKLKKLLDLIGIRPNQTLNLVNLFAIFSFVFCASAATAYILFATKIIADLGNSFFLFISMLHNYVILSSFIFKHKKVYNLIGEIEKTIKKRNFLNLLS